MTSRQSPELTDHINYDTGNMVFGLPVRNPVRGGSVVYYRIAIQTKYSTGGVGDLLLETESIFSFGLKENRSIESGEITGYILPLCLYSMEEATER